MWLIEVIILISFWASLFVSGKWSNIKKGAKNVIKITYSIFAISLFFGNKWMIYLVITLKFEN